jgi:hypothetical protein
MEFVLLDVAGHRRSPATVPGYDRGRPPRNKGGEQYPADPQTVEEIVGVMRTIGDRSDDHRLRALIVLLWRAGRRGKGRLCRIRHGGLPVRSCTNPSSSRKLSR